MRFLIPTLTAMLLLSSSATFAEDAPTKTDRKGFFLGFDVGGGGISLAGANRGAFLMGLKIGGGLSDRILLMAETSGAVTRQNGATVSLSSAFFAGQFFINDNFYVRPAVGFGVIRSETGLTTVDSRTGFSMAAASGYEFRLTRMFALSPEAKVNYARIEGSNFASYGVACDLRWYF